MYSILFLLFVFTLSLFIVSVESNDIVLGYATPYSRKVYSAVKYANPALWRRRDDLMISAPDHDVISAVYVTDLRSDKEGVAYVEAGGIGQKTVTIALKSPSILREYKFSVEVYAQNVHSAFGSPGIGYPAAINGYPHTVYDPHAQLSGFGNHYGGVILPNPVVGYPSTNPYGIGKKK